MLSDARARRSLEAKARARAESAQLASQLAEQVAAERSLQSKQDRQRAKRVELEAWVRELVGEVESRTLAATTELQAGLCALEQDVLETRRVSNMSLLLAYFRAGRRAEPLIGS